MSEKRDTKEKQAKKLQELKKLVKMEIEGGGISAEELGGACFAGREEF